MTKGDCVTCALARWDTTANGRRHPNGRGQCVFKLETHPLPVWAESARQLVKQYNTGRGQSIWRDEPYENCEAHVEKA